MDTLFRIVAAALVAVILCLVLGRQNKELAAVLSIGVCAMVLIAATQFLRPVLDFFESLGQIAKFEDSYIRIIIKSVGIALIAQIAELICADSGNGALGKSIHIFATIGILWVSLPVYCAFLDLVQQILEGI